MAALPARDTSPGSGRRSIYRYVWRGIADPFMEALDFPDLGLLTPARTYSVSSLQALSLYNDAFVLNSSTVLAKRLEKSQGKLSNQVVELIETILLRKPSNQERLAMTSFATKQGLPALCRVLLNSNEFLFID